MAKSKDKKTNPTSAPTPQPTFNNSDSTSSGNESFVDMVYNFLVAFIQNFIHLLITIIIGIVILWGCKVSQASLLPTDIFCYPYEEKQYKGTSFMPINECDKFDININLKKIEDVLMSEKIKFRYTDFEPNQKNMLIDLLSSIKFAYWNKGTIQYIISILESLVVTNYGIQNTFYLTLNKYLNEPLIVFLAPYFMPPYLMIVGIYNYIFLIYTWFANMGWLFTKNITKEKKGRPIWKEMTLKQDGFIQMIISLILVWVFFLVFLFGNFILFPGMIIFVLIYCFFSVTMYNAEIKRVTQNEKGDTVEKTKSYGIIEAIKDFLIYKKHFILAIVTYQLLLGVGMHFGYTSLVLCVIGVILLVFYSDVYKPIIPEYLSEAIDNYNFASNKKCPDNSEFFKKDAESTKADNTNTGSNDQGSSGEDGSTGANNNQGQTQGQTQGQEQEQTQEQTQGQEQGQLVEKSYKGKVDNDESNDAKKHIDNDEDNDASNEDYIYSDSEAAAAVNANAQENAEETNENHESESEATPQQGGGYNLIKNAKTIHQQGGKKLVKTIKDLTRFLGRDGFNKSLSNKKGRY